MPNPSICVFCGTAWGSDPHFGNTAREVGVVLARQRLTLVYGGGRVGLMGILADAVLEAGGRAIGVIPQALATREVAHDGLTEMHVVSGMHERKALMATLSTAFLTLPGGIGTLEEFFEILSWGSLGIHHKPIGVLNVARYFDPLLALLDHGIAQQFIRAESLRPLLVSDRVEPLIADLLAYQPPAGAPRGIGIEES
jgi:uncharacterized protein (TIGR00730 family)